MSRPKLTRPLRLPARAHQHRRLDELATELGIEKPHVFWAHDARDVIERLEAITRQPSLSGFAASTGPTDA